MTLSFTLTSTGETISLPVLCAAYIRCPGISNLYRHRLSGYQFTAWSSGASKIHFFCTRKFTLEQCRIRTTDLPICSRTRYHWTKAPRLYIRYLHIRICCICVMTNLCKCFVNDLTMIIPDWFSPWIFASKILECQSHLQRQKQCLYRYVIKRDTNVIIRKS